MKSLTSVLAGCIVMSTFVPTAGKKQHRVQTLPYREESQTITKENAAADAGYEEL